ncbi:dolichyl-phosphate beta-glucosyltransferase [Phlyctochytrium planicorne]|nr:dolichyl-phosphate beta-glucosyltransferase [Phlyctochytrium planicorne]
MLAILLYTILIAGVLGLIVLAILSITAKTPRSPTANELHYLDALTDKRKPFPSLLDDLPSDSNSKEPQDSKLRKRAAATHDAEEEENVRVALSVIVPAYNETKRLPAMLEEAMEFLEKRRERDGELTFEVIVVDDGSKDDTSGVARRFAKERKSRDLRVLTLETNRGKGGAVAQGILVARGDRILFADADGSTKFADIEKLEGSLGKVSKNGLGVAIGSRAHMVKTEAVVKRSAIRNFLMYSFHTVLLILGISSIKDTQCGFKLFSRNAARKIFTNVHVEGWIFDIELLLLASWQNIPMVEVAVNWHEIDGSKMSLLKDSIVMATDLLIIRFNYLTGVWRIKKVPERTKKAS